MTTVDRTKQTTPILRDRAEKFTMRGLPLLNEGATTTPLVLCENLFIHSKVYSRGGENALHSHKSDDHAFFVLAGSALFYDSEGNVTEVGPLEGIAIPKGVAYRFLSSSEENLVILRMAGAAIDYYTMRAADERLAPDGSVLDAKDPRNGTPALPVVESGEYFGV